jgi:glycosidase
MSNSLNRRGFLRLCVVAAGGAVMAACQQSLQDIATATAVIPTPTPRSITKISLLGSNQDVWTWSKPVNLEVSGECQNLVVNVNGRQFETEPDGKAFTSEVRFSAGENQVSAVCLSADTQVRSEPVTYNERLRAVPTAVIQIKLDGKIVLDGSPSLPSEDDGSPIMEYVWSERPNNPTSLQLSNAELTGKTLTLTPPSVDGEYYLSLKVKDQAGREDTGAIYFVVENGQPRIPDFDHENPAWVESTIVYGVVPFLFGDPAFHAIRERLDDLKDLGINALWLAPITVHPADDYGYAVTDYFNLDAAYGTKDDFRALVQAAHEHGIHILMDFVPNHSSDQHPYFVDTKKNGKQSPYWNFYERDASGNPTHYFDWTNLPNFNYDHPEVQRMMVEAFSYWVREFDVDGFRVDAAWAIKERNPQFWLPWRRELKRIKPDLLLLAEAGARDPYYFQNGFDAAYDWTDQVGGWAWKVIWETYKLRLLAYNLTYALTNRPDGFDPDALIFRFLNNNDTGKRFITRLGEGVTRVATALLLTLPGIPCIYTGDEYGLEFEPYEELTPLTFKEQYPGLRDYHKKLIELRKTYPSLHSRQWSRIDPDAVRQTVYSYIRSGASQDQPILVLLNFSEEPAEFKFDVPKEFSAQAANGRLYDLLTEENVAAFENGRVKISVPAQAARILIDQAAK